MHICVLNTKISFYSQNFTLNKFSKLLMKILKIFFPHFCHPQILIQKTCEKYWKMHKKSKNCQKIGIFLKKYRSQHEIAYQKSKYWNTVPALLQAAASINFEGLWVRLLFESGFYSRFFHFIYISKLPMKIPFQNGAYCFCSLNNKKVMKKKKKKK